MLSYKNEERISAAQALKHPYFSEMAALEAPIAGASAVPKAVSPPMSHTPQTNDGKSTRESSILPEINAK